MNTLLTQPPVATDQRHGADAAPTSRVLVLVESTPNSAAALREAARLADERTHLTVVSLAPQSVAPRCCARGPGVEVVNCVVRDEAQRDLAEAREILGDAARRATFKSLVGGQDPPLGEWAAGRSFDLILLPSRRLSFGGHPFARRLRRQTRAELRLVP